MDSVAIKLAATALVNKWIERAGIQKQQAAARVELDYHGFYRAYLDPNRRLNQEPDRTVMLIRAFTVSCTEQERCTAAEALRFCTLAQLPLHRYNELRELFPANEWNQAIATYAPMLLPEAKATPLHSAEPRVAVSAPHWLPFARNPLFGGRDEELQALAELFRHDAPQTTAICGMGGVGRASWRMRSLIGMPSCSPVVCSGSAAPTPMRLGGRWPVAAARVCASATIGIGCRSRSRCGWCVAAGSRRRCACWCSMSARMRRCCGSGGPPRAVAMCW